MSQKTEKAVNNYKNGYTCAQAVACAFCEEAGIDEKTMFRLTEAQGVGLGGMEGHCGALSGAAAVLGAVNSTADLERTDSKGKSIRLSRKLTKRFQEKNGAVICRELKGIETGRMLRSCPGCVEDAAEILEELWTGAQQRIAQMQDLAKA